MSAGIKTIWLSTCHSTNTYLKNYIAGKQVPNGYTVCAVEQTNGRGQRGNSWESEKGKNLTFSSVYYFKSLSVKDIFYLNMAVSLAIADFLGSLGIAAEIKWPNDIYVGKSKISGILIEPSVRADKVQHAITGIGLNVNQKVFATKTAVSVINLLSKESDLKQLLQDLISFVEKFITQLNHGEFENLTSDYHKKLYLKDKVGAFEIQNKVVNGIIRGVNESGKLILETDSGLSEFDMKELKFL